MEVKFICPTPVLNKIWATTICYTIYPFGIQQLQLHNKAFIPIFHFAINLLRGRTALCCRPRISLVTSFISDKQTCYWSDISAKDCLTSLDACILKLPIDELLYYLPCFCCLMGLYLHCLILSCIILVFSCHEKQYIGS